MIQITRMDRKSIILNPDHIVSIEETPDTVLTLFNGHHLLVRERASVIIDRIEAYRAGIVRRSGRQARKYLRRSRRLGYRSLTLNRDNVLDTRADQKATIPLHTQDI